jgi:hypothetical protein
LAGSGRNLPQRETEMTHSDPGGPKESENARALRGGEGPGGTEALPPTARRTLDDIADALGVTAALLKHEGPLETSHTEESAKLVEAATLLQAFIRISSPALRRRCIAFVQDAAAQDRGRA